jgi:hypothetical protein
MQEHKDIQIINKNNKGELKLELYNRKRDLVSIRIHTTLKQDPKVIEKAKKLKEECTIISVLIKRLETLEMKNREELSNNKEKLSNNNDKKNTKKLVKR